MKITEKNKRIIELAKFIRQEADGIYTNYPKIKEWVMEIYKLAHEQYKEKVRN